MSEILELLKVIVIVGGALTALYLILLSIPKSKLRDITLKIYGTTMYFMTGILILYILNPVDLIPDLIPVLGQVDDAAAVISAIFAGSFGWMSFKKVREIE